MRLCVIDRFKTTFEISVEPVGIYLPNLITPIHFGILPAIVDNKSA